ncbi:MAG: hypothetical protein Satyrvirus2_32 [Satyrvirus sp.]|uniref:Uncharacterized protein n=1 Tax=Satyrvirus sp. TaxID=2487771 RepID=A0A3G5AFG9_9VIRU|nr:MAG: hypothetical protein Satyrvirus2_32 [Satyrvirus sp.]
MMNKKQNKNAAASAFNGFGTVDTVYIFTF